MRLVAGVHRGRRGREATRHYVQCAAFATAAPAVHAYATTTATRNAALRVAPRRTQCHLTSLPRSARRALARRPGARAHPTARGSGARACRPLTITRAAGALASATDRACRDVSTAYVSTPDGARLEIVSHAPTPLAPVHGDATRHEWTTPPSSPSPLSPLLFVHGSLHASWCWQEHFLRFFAEHGYAAHALSLRGHGNSRLPSRDGGDTRSRSVSPDVRDFTTDIESALRAIATADAYRRAPVLVAHSFGGLPAQRVAMRQAQRGARDGADARARIAGLVLCASMSPDGIVPLVARTVQQRGIRHALRITRCLAARAVLKRNDDARWLFFSGALDESLVQRFREALVRSAPAVTPRLDGAGDLARAFRTGDDDGDRGDTDNNGSEGSSESDDGAGGSSSENDERVGGNVAHGDNPRNRRARRDRDDGDSRDHLVHDRGSVCPVLVVGGDHDRLVDETTLRETMEFWRRQHRAARRRSAATPTSDSRGVRADARLVVMPQQPHDFMLDVQWCAAAGTLLDWLTTHVRADADDRNVA